MDQHEDDMPYSREVDHRFAEGHAPPLVDTLTTCAMRDGASMEGVYLTLVCAAVSVSQKYDLPDRVDGVLAVLRSGRIKLRESARLN